jgi:translation initiation factor IF-2
MERIKEGQIKELNIIIKADVQGSLEALKSSLAKLSNQEVKVNIVHDATGGITESDVVLAVASKAIIIGFNVRPDTNAKVRAERDKISIELYSVIYKAIEDVKLALEGLLTPETVEQAVGKVEVRQVFSVPKIGRIAGAYVLEGKIARASNVRVIRDNVVVFDGKIASLKRFTDDVKEVAAGYECGLSLERYQDIKEKDILEVYELVQEKRTLSDVGKQ